MAEVIRIEVRYSGRVQGVGFRATARACARPHPVTGWVQNQPNGSVLLQAQGAAGALEAFRADLRRAMGGKIAAETATPVSPIAGESGFVVRA